MHDISNTKTSTAGTQPCAADLPLAELQGRAGALARELGRQYAFNAREWRVHWHDMVQTALLALLAHSRRPLGYAYSCARTALKDYAWVHVRGLNGGWKSLAARDYTLVDTADSLDMAGSASRRPADSRVYEPVPRPVEWAVMGREAGPPPETVDLFRDLLTVLVGMSGKRWYPEQMYRGALIVALRLTGHTWEDVASAVGELPHDTLVNIYQEYRRDYLLPYAALSLLGREVMVLRGRLRVQWFETLRPDWLRRPQRKIVVFPHGIYTITYRADRRRKNRLLARLQKGRRVGGRVKVKQVYLGPAEMLTKATLWEKSLLLERRFAAFLEEATGNLGRMNASRQVMFGVV